MPREPQKASPQKVLNTLSRNETQVLMATRVSMPADACSAWRHAVA